MEKISFYHSPARRAIRGATHTITVAANPGVQAVSAVVGGEKQLLNPAGEREGLRLWQGKLLPPPGADVLTYTLYADLSPMGSYSIPLDTPRLGAAGDHRALPEYEGLPHHIRRGRQYHGRAD